MKASDLEWHSVCSVPCSWGGGSFRSTTLLKVQGEDGGVGEGIEIDQVVMDLKSREILLGCLVDI